MARVVLIGGLILLTGCAGRTTTAARPPVQRSQQEVVNATASPVAVAAVPGGEEPLPAAGRVTPVPAGCLELWFVDPADPTRVVRHPSGRIDQVVLPSGRREFLIWRLSPANIDDLVRRIETAYTTNDLYILSHIPTGQDETKIPGRAAWEYLRGYLRETDYVWTFGTQEHGVAVVRDNRLIAIAVVTRTEPAVGQ